MEIVTRARIFSQPTRLDDGVFEALFTEHYPRVYNVLFRLVGDPDEADDLAAETFWRLWERPPRQGENLGGWLYRVATRLGYNALRSARRRGYYETEARQGTLDLQLSDNPAQAAEKADERRHVQAVLRRMSLREVQILVMRHSGLPYKEIASAVGVSTGSVGALLARAEARFETLYREGEQDAPKR